MNSERNPHLLNDPSGGGGCIIGSTSVPPTGGPIHGYGSPPGSHGGGGCGDMGVGPPCPVPTPPWVKPPSNHSNSGMMTPESDVSSCSSPASSSYGASSQQQHLQQRAFYGSTTNYSNNCATGGNNAGGGGGNDLSSSAGVVHTTMNQIRGGTYNNNSNAISSSTNSSGMFYDASGEVIDQSQYYHHSHHQTQHFQHQQQFSTGSPNSMHIHHKTGSNCSTPSLENNANLTGECSGGGGGGDSAASSGGGGNFYGFYNTNQSGQYTDYHQHHEQHHSDLHQHHDTSTGVYPGSDHTNASGNRMHQYYRQDGSSVSANSVPVGHGYFNNNAPNSNYPTSSGTSTPPTRYGSPMVFPNNHNNYGPQQQQLQTHHHHLHHQNLQGGQMPPRRNSIESFSSEPGDMHNSYSARFPCGNTPVNVNNMSHNNHNHPHQGNMPQIATHHHPTSFPTGSAGPVENVIKRECGSISNRGSPVMNQINSMNSTGCWSPQQGGGGYFPSTSPNNDCTSSSSPNNICSNESATNSATNVNRTNFMHHNNAYNQNICGGGSGESGNCASTGFYPPQQSQHHQPPTPTQFKSCAYEQSQQHHDIKEGIPSMVANAVVGNNLKAGSAVKHRSLSLSMPLPSYLETNGSSRPDLDSNFVNNHRQQLAHHEQLHGSNNHNQPFSSMVDTSPQHLQHHHHSHCTTSSLVPPPEQNLLTPNSDDDIPFRAASAGGQSDLDSSYETMGEEGCSSTSTSVASHCMNTSGNSTCSGGDNSAAVSTMAIATTTEHLHSISVNNTSSTQQDCQHHHHHHHHVSSGDNLAFSSATSISSCMQSQHHHHHLHQHHHVASSMNIGMLELPNSTVALCTTNVDDLDESSSDSSVELHNVISAVVENSSIETPENTMMGDDDEVDNVVEGMMVGDGIPTENCFHHHQDNQADVNVISTTTNETDEMDDDDDDDVGGDHDHNVDDNCSESSMSHINSSFTADMFCDGNSNQDSNGLIIATSNVLSPNSNDNNAEDTNMINSSSGNNDFSCISEEANFIGNEVEHIEEDTSGNVSTNQQSQQTVKSVPSSPSGTDSTSLSLPSPSSSSVTPKATKRSFSETEKDYRKISDVGKAMSTSSTSSMTTTTSADAKASSLTTTFGATLRKACRGESVVRSGDGGSSATASTTSQQSVNNDDFNSMKNNNKEDNNGSENSGKNNVNSVCKEENSNVGGSTNNSNKSSNATTSCGGVSASNTSTSVPTASSSCKAIDIIISSSVNNVITTSCGNNNDNNNRVSIPKGWKREILKGTTNDNGNPNGTTGVLYIR